MPPLPLLPSGAFKERANFGKTDSKKDSISFVEYLPNVPLLGTQVSSSGRTLDCRPRGKACRAWAFISFILPLLPKVFALLRDGHNILILVSEGLVE